MAIMQAVNVTLLLVGDGAATAFTYSFSQLFNLTPDSGYFLNQTTLPSSASYLGGQLGLSANATLDGFGNLTLTFTTPPPAGVAADVQVQLLFNSGNLQGTTNAWTSATTVNSTWTLPLNGNKAITVGFVVSGTVTAGTILFEVSQDGAAWFPIQGSVSNVYTALTGWTPGVGSLPIQFDVGGYAFFRLRLNPVITGSGTVTFIMQGIDSSVEPNPVVGQTDGTKLHVTLDDAAGGNAANTVVKGTQAGRALGTQDLKDSGRTNVTLFGDQITGVTSEALATMQIVKGLVAQTAATSYTVTAGKTLRIQSMSVTVRDTTSTLAMGRVRIRGVNSGSVAANSPLVAALEVVNMPGTAAANIGESDMWCFPDGIEIPGGAQIGVSHIENTTSSTISFCIVGYEY